MDFNAIWSKSEPDNVYFCVGSAPSAAAYRL